MSLLQGPKPFFGLTPWSQPFSLPFLWNGKSIGCIPFLKANWTYENNRYVLTTIPNKLPPVQTINHINLATPHVTFAFKGQLQRLIDQDPSV